MYPLQQHDDELLIDGPAANAFMAVRNATLLVSAAEKQDGAALWIICMLHTAAYSLLTVWLEQHGEHKAYSVDSVRKARGFDEFDNPRVDPDKLRQLPLRDIQSKLSELTAISSSFPFGDFALQVMTEISMLRNSVQHAKPVAHAFDHDYCKDMIAFLVVYVGATLKKIPKAYFGAYRSTDDVLDELKAFAAAFESKWGVIKASL